MISTFAPRCALASPATSRRRKIDVRFRAPQSVIDRLMPQFSTITRVETAGIDVVIVSVPKNPPCL